MSDDANEGVPVPGARCTRASDGAHGELAAGSCLRLERGRCRSVTLKKGGQLTVAAYVCSLGAAPAVGTAVVGSGMIPGGAGSTVKLVRLTCADYLGAPYDPTLRARGVTAEGSTIYLAIREEVFPCSPFTVFYATVSTIPAPGNSAYCGAPEPADVAAGFVQFVDYPL